MNKSIFYDFALCTNIIQVLKTYVELRLALENKAEPFDTERAKAAAAWRANRAAENAAKTGGN